MTLSLWVAIIMAATTAYVFVGLDKQGLFKVPDREPGMMLLSADGHVVAESGSFFGDEARVAELPSYLPQAVIAIEDRRFRKHFGIDIQGLVRASVANYRAGRIVQGGSTITQQLAKNLFLKPDRTYQRKFQEAVLALWLESKYSKDEILQLYLNRVYFGSGSFGVEKAAQKYFGKSAREVSLAEAAMLAGLLKAPTTYNPINHPKRAEARAREVIKDMVEIGFITDDDLDQAGSVVKTVKPADYIPATQYIVDWVGDQLPDLIGRFDKSIVVETTLDRNLQALAEKTITRTLNKQGRKLNASQGAMVVMDTTGGVRAMVGGKSYIKSQFNRAVSAKRQPGSAFKPFVYLTAVEFGMSPDSVEYDEPIEIDGWKPHNYSGRYYGPVTLRQALSRSLNTVAVRLGQSVGPRSVVTTAHRMGVNSELKANASIALGTSEVSLLELTSAFAPFSNGGNAVVPHVVTRITTREGKVLYERSGNGLGSVVSSYDLGAMNDMLRAVVQQGTGTRAQLNGQDVGGKTGTTQDYRDAWFVGYTAHMVAGVWVGNDDNSPTKRVTGGSLPATMWNTVMTAAHNGLPKVDLPGEGTLYGQTELPVAYDTGGIVDMLQNMFGTRQDTELEGQQAPREAGSSRAERRERMRKRLKDLEDSR
ncbi:MAG: PBP1A family penicillin-binding protein [Hyphomicrobiales bacterium]|nr:PBP1A family penicillin-binding protein [Hyphomicrobiales bacterium]